MCDYEAATAVGMPFGAVAWGYTMVEALTACAPAVVVHQVEEIVSCVVENERNLNADRLHERWRAGGQLGWNHAERPS
jgi:hypothetical protein